MNKKYLSALLFGALTLASTGTFTSCKDYDDDIENLQGQIDKLATKEDLSSQLSTLQAALDAAGKDAKDAIAKATAAETAAKTAGDAAAAAKAAAEKSAAEAKAAAVEAAKAEVEKTKADLEKLVADGMAENKKAMDAMRAQVEAAKKQVEEVVGKIADMVTDVELQIVDNGIDAFATLSFSSILEKANVFQDGIANPITFTKGAQKQKSAKVLVRVSPTNAVLTPEMISFVNSKGENLNESLQVVKVEPYKDLLTRAVTANGLWEVSVALKNYDKDAFKKIQLNDPTKGEQNNTILYAVQVNNTLATAENRYVTSAYDCTLAWSEFKPSGELKFTVDGVNVEGINNRYSTESKSISGTLPAGTKVYKELVWSDSNKPAVKAIEKGSDINVKQGDDRVAKEVHNVVQGEAIQIALGEKDGNNFKSLAEARAMYVVLDKANAVESIPSELNAWESYSITGLNTVVEGTSTEITINADEAINDIIGFRVFAVNHDGTLIDPDGKAFYVRLGKAGIDWNAAATKVLATNPAITAVTAAKSEKVAIALSKLTGAASATWSTDKCAKGDTPAFSASFLNAQGKVVFTTETADFSGVKFEDVKFVQTTPACSSWLDYKDNKAYNGKLTVKDANGFVMATLDVSMTKTLPTAMPEGYTLKDKQVINGVYNCFMIADNWAAEQATTGSMPIKNLINFGTPTTADTNAPYYDVEFANSAKENNKPVAVTAKGDASVIVDKSYIDNKTEHATVVYFNYGKISTETKNANGAIVDYRIEGSSFKTVYNCFYKPAVHTWNWATRENLGLTAKDSKGNYTKPMPYSTILTYGKSVDKAHNQYVFGKNTIDGTFSKLLSAPYEGSLVVESAKLISDATQKEDYFKVSNDLQFEAIMDDLGSNPKENVPSTLIITCKDSYGHNVVIKLAMTVAPRK